MNMITDDIRAKIHNIRNMQVILDEDISELYGVKIKRLNEQVKRNIGRFPGHFMFQLTHKEHKTLRSQNATLRLGHGEHRKFLPYVFTEQGVAMLSGVLKSDTAVRTSIQIIDAFIEMRKFIASNAQVFQRLDNVEKKLIKHDIEFEQIFKAIEETDIKPKKGIFFDGQIFDAYKIVSDIITSATESITIIDNYIDHTTLTLLSKKNKNVNVIIFTKEISKKLELDLQKFNSQYPKVKIKIFRQCHDRFIIIDNKEVYHFGASLKDLGKKWFAFSKFDKDALRLLERLK